MIIPTHKEVTEMSQYTTLDNCVACGSDQLHNYLDLHNQPLANSYHDKSTPLPEYPLGLNVCGDCWHSQLTVAVDPELMFKDYLYVTGTSQTLRDYCDWFADYCGAYQQPGSVLDIACNDGTQLDSFAARGWKTYGVDPAENLYPICSAKHDTVCDFWPIQTGRKYDLIIAQNVFAHNSNPHAFLCAMRDQLREGGTIRIQTSQAYWLENNQFDTTYHEHISFFCANSMNTLVKRCGLELVDITIGDIHGGSYIFTIKHSATTTQRFSIAKHIQDESYKYSELYHTVFADGVKTCLADLANIVKHFQQQDYIVLGYGAAAKGNTVLNAGKIRLNGIIDDNPLKQNCYTPGSDIRIYDSSVLNSLTQPIVVVPLAWNFFDEIQKNVKSVTDKNIVYVKYFPKLEVIT